MVMPLDMADEPCRPVAIVGAGNWLVGRDRVGPEVLAELRRRALPAEVELWEVGSTGLALLDCIRAQELLIVVDAAALGGPVGHIRVLEPDLEAPPEASSTSVHQLGPLEALWVAKMLYPERLPSRIRLILVETGHGDSAVPPELCQRVVAVIEREIDGWRAGRSARTNPGERGPWRRSSLAQ